MNRLLAKVRSLGRPLWLWLWPLREAIRKMRLYAVAPLGWLNLGSAVIGPPAGVFAKTSDWLASEAGSRIPGASITEIYPAEEVRRPLPHTLPGACHWKFRQDEVQTSPATWVLALPGGRFWGYYGGSVISPDDFLLEDLSRDIRPGRNHQIFLQARLPAMRELAGIAAVLSAPEAGTNYFHWMFDLLPRLHLLDKAGFTTGRTAYYLCNHRSLPFQMETLDTLGVPRDKLIATSATLHLRADLLVAAASPLCHAFDTPPWVCRFLREKFLDGSKPGLPGGRRLYLSRNRSPFRRITNEEGLVALLSARGFEKVDLYGLTVAEQARLFAGAETVVSAHGAGLTNLVFCRPGTRVIELFAPQYVKTTYWGLSAVCRLEYAYMLGEGPQLPDYIEGNNRLDDIAVDLAQMRELLRLCALT